MPISSLLRITVVVVALCWATVVFGQSPKPTFEEVNAKAEVGDAHASTVADIPDGSIFGISEISATETPDTEADTNLTLRISVKKRPNTVIDQTKVKIQVFFYDTHNRDIKLTDAEVNYEWLTPDHTWAGPKPEVLAATYVRPKNKARRQDDSGKRKYLGYIVRVYYDDKLQAVRADPTKLLSIFPPPSTASFPRSTPTESSPPAASPSKKLHFADWKVAGESVVQAVGRSFLIVLIAVVIIFAIAAIILAFRWRASRLVALGTATAILTIPFALLLIYSIAESWIRPATKRITYNESSPTPQKHSGSGSPFERSSDFAEYSTKLREQALLQVEPQVFVPTTFRTATAPAPTAAPSSSEAAQKLPPDAGRGTLVVTSSPQGQTYELIDANGIHRTGTTPATLTYVPAGYAQVIYKRDGFSDYIDGVWITENSTSSITWDFPDSWRIPMGRLSSQSPKPVAKATPVPSARTYRVSGPVIDSGNGFLAIQKGRDRWDIARTPSTVVTGDLKPGDCVSVTYYMVMQDMYPAFTTYHVTGTILDDREAMIAIQKGSDRWEICHRLGREVEATGKRVTIPYKMIALNVMPQSPSPEPVAKATPTPEATPPLRAFFGGIIAPNGGNEWREPTPEGGYIIWRKREDGDWRPTSYVPPPLRQNPTPLPDTMTMVPYPPPPLPPSTGIYGSPLVPYGKEEMREKTPDGGYIIWKIQQTPQQKDWRPIQYVPPPKGKQL